VMPEIRLAPIEALEVERTTAEVTEADVDAMIERLRQQQLRYQAVSRPAQNGDRVSVDFEGSIDGVPFPGGKGENTPIVLGAGRMLAQLEEGLIGASAGEVRDIGVDFPADYRASELAGKHATFKVTVKSVEEGSLPPLDEEFCRAFAVNEGGIARLREEVADNMRRELKQSLRNRNKAAVLDKLLAANPLEVPNALLEAQIRDMQVEIMRRAGTQDVSKAPPREPLIEPARRRASLGLLIAELIRREGLKPEPARVNERLDEMVSTYGDAAAMKRAYLQDADAMRQIEGLALEDQVVEWILARAKVTEQPTSFREVMNFQG